MIRVLNVGILHRDYDMSKAMEAEVQHMVIKMSQFMTVLDTMIKFYEVCKEEMKHE